MATRYYTAIIEKGNEEFGVFFPDFPGCISGGKTAEEAAICAEEALSLHISGMVEDSDDIPAPTPLDEIERDPEVNEVIRVLVRAELPGKSLRVNITLEEGLLEAIDKVVNRKGEKGGRSGFLARAARRQLREESSTVA